jgi:hypothetical protein
VSLVGSAVTDIHAGANFFADDRMARFTAAEAALTKALSSVVPIGDREAIDARARDGGQ